MYSSLSQGLLQHLSNLLVSMTPPAWPRPGILAALADAKRQDLEVRPVLGAEADALIKEVYATPPETVKLAIEYMKE
jgi:hypothetical protein